ncbi:alpha carbonic anhydrase 1, chloroplastic isoform X1 [Cinnamomum micranthum f. kanehirae]|uniref:Alpha carbonic anhydrase 1, chloroplastic isoform X1 n=1 Tax=Cinnamomum micranthum f. kanehirae TaxID=337451 RepID=A0A443NW77_9MAGN|nr:alpha carbonic anhydrase 1, chloroplastic isoform X1 [Cinnamomum micranthum f. kanehirae]
MTMPTHIVVVFVVVLMIAAFAHGHDQDGEVQFGYKGDLGPDKWGNLNNAFQDCSNGKLQSPVNIVKKDAFLNNKLGSLKREYNKANATLVNNGVNIGIQWQCETGNLKVDGKNYTLKESIWHTPSEHTFDGEGYVAELQHFHYSEDGKIAVVACLYKKGKSDAFYTELKDSLAELSKETCAADEQAQILFGVVKPKYLMKSSSKYYRYVGSLTLPPCTENITWIILGKVRELSDEQIEALKAPLGEDYKSNARPTQPLNARKLNIYERD